MEAKKGHDRNPLAFAITEAGGDYMEGGDAFNVREIASGIRSRAANTVVRRKPLVTRNYDNDTNIAPSSERYLDYLSGLIPLADEINRLQDRDGAVMTARSEAEEMLGRVDMAESIMEVACISINSFKIPFIYSITESGRAKWLREKAISELSSALHKLESKENDIISVPIDWPELDYFDVRGSMPVSDVDNMADDLARITEVFNEMIEILNEHLESATEHRDQSHARFETIKKQLQIARESLVGRSEISVLDIYEIIDRLQMR